MSEQDRAYYLSRAEAELALARHATHPAAMRAHYHLAGFYLDKAHSEAVERAMGRPKLILVTSAPVQAA